MIGFVKKIKFEIIQKLLVLSLRQSNRMRGEYDIKFFLSKVAPDISRQYSCFTIDMHDEYMVEKLRCQHAFQMSLAQKAIENLIISHKKALTVVDIGDSAGTHLMYLAALSEKIGLEINSLSVNLDEQAVRKIKSKGLEAICCRAEELHLQSINADIFLSYEMLEHLFDPISFLHSMATKAECEYFVITIPYVQTSRVGLAHIRNNATNNGTCGENTHIFELCPEDWNLIFKFSGWEIIYSDKYTQYPKSGLLNIMKYYWRKHDFDGFYGVILKKNLDIANMYKDW